MRKTLRIAMIGMCFRVVEVTEGSAALKCVSKPYIHEKAAIKELQKLAMKYLQTDRNFILPLEAELKNLILEAV